MTGRIIGSAMEVHRELGPGLLESAYRACLVRQLREDGLSFAQEVSLPVIYKGMPTGGKYRLDLVVEDEVIVELKSLTYFNRLHRAQLATYLKLSGKQVGLLINFNVPLLKLGIRRVASPPC